MRRTDLTTASRGESVVLDLGLRMRLWARWQELTVLVAHQVKSCRHNGSLPMCPGCALSIWPG